MWSAGGGFKSCRCHIPAVWAWAAVAGALEPALGAPRFLICKLGVTGVVSSLGELCLGSGVTLCIARPEQVHFVERL